ncbi:hypothetical protein OAY26_02450 [Acidimicrobiia bacterium]|nr:hypothetical protein [Acidimicrobiia bacterium]
MKNYSKFKNNIYSQNGEDGVIQEILRELDIGIGTCIEFGASRGKDNSNTYSLVENNWDALYIESDKNRFSELIENTKNFKNVAIVNKFVSHKPGKNDLDSILIEKKFEKDCDILSVDIDSEDLKVWEIFSGRPKIVIIEINSTIKPGILNYHNEKEPGNSFSSTIAVAENKGYTLLCHTGNCIFLRNDLVTYSRLNKIYIYFPTLLFNRAWLKKSYPVRYLKHKFNKFFIQAF